MLVILVVIFVKKKKVVVCRHTTKLASNIKTLCSLNCLEKKDYVLVIY